MSQKSFRKLAPSLGFDVEEFDLDPSSGEEGDCMPLRKAPRLAYGATSISIVREFKPGQWAKVGVVTVHRDQKSREPLLKLGDVREVVDFPLRVDSEIDKKYKDKGHKRKAPSAVGCVLAMRNPPPFARPGCICDRGRIGCSDVEYKAYIDWLIKSKSDPIKSLQEYLEHKEAMTKEQLAQRSSANAAASGLARSGDDGIDGGASAPP
jgi:hypothetical protein